jgi:translation initiation factor 2 subunit 1
MSEAQIYSVPWFPNEFPAKEEIVTVRLTRVDDMGIWVELLEYACKEGMIPLGQYTTRRTRRVPKNVKVGKIDVAVVSQVDEDKDNMDLTRQGLKEQDITAANKRFSDTRSFMSAIAHVSEEAGVPFPELVRAIGYPFGSRFPNAFIGLQHCYESPEIIDGLDVADGVKEKLRAHVNKIFHPQEVRVQAQFEAEVLNPAGVDALRDALVAGYEGAPEQLEIHVVAPPLYSASLTSSGPGTGIDVINAVLERIERKIAQVKGRFAVKEAPKQMSADEHQKWKNQLSDLKDADDEEDE